MHVKNCLPTDVKISLPDDGKIILPPTHKIDEIISKAVAAFPDKPQMSNHKRVSDIKANRKEEIERQYQESVQKKEEPSPKPPETQEKSLIQQMLEAELNEAYGLN